VSAYVPLSDSTGKVEAVLGVDFKADDWQKTLAQVRLAVLGVVGIITGVIVVSLIIVRLARHELEARARAGSAIRESGALPHWPTAPGADLDGGS
jgi:tetrahydromethanopterin S-methyltransferase subunit E